jgi:indole-3-glycerol phosphate synthase
MKTANYLKDIIHRKRKEVDKLIDETQINPQSPLNKIFDKTDSQTKRFSMALKQPGLSVIGEVKRQSPSCGKIQQIVDPAELALNYCRGGASAISVLTDSQGFGGSLSDLKNVVHAVSLKYPHVAILRKDFIIHPLQLAETALSGAHAVLLIANVIGKDLKFFLQETERLGLEALTEIHDLADLKLALEAQAPIIGINHRNLATFEVDLSLSDTLKPLIPPYVITVAESGIHQPEQAMHMLQLGFDAILVGEALVRAENPSQLIKLLKGQKR